MRHTVLVIDDQWSMQELARIVLRAAGYRVLLANDVVTGLCLARTEHPDITVLDVSLTEDTRYAFLDNLRQDTTTAMFPLLLISTTPTTDHLLASLPTGMASCLQKPFRPPELLTMVDRLLRHDDMPIAV